MAKIFVFGSLNMDLVITAPYMPVSGETLTGSGFMTAGGGKGANQAAAIGKLGGAVKMCGSVGADAFGDALIASLSGAGVDVSCIQRVDVSTGVAVIVIVDGDNRIILDKGANGVVTTAEIDAFLQDAQAGDIFLTQLESPYGVVEYALRKAKSMGLYTVLNPAPAKTDAVRMLDAVDMLTPNESETKIFAGEDDVEEAIRKVRALGVKDLIVTLGAKGCRYIGTDTDKTYPCFRVNAIDTTAAGDTFTGAVVTELSRGRTVAEAIPFATAASAIAVTRRGAQTSIPTRAEVEAFLLARNS